MEHKTREKSLVMKEDKGQTGSSSVNKKVQALISQMMSWGVHLGHHSSETAQSMKKQIWGYRSDKAILNRSYTMRQRTKVTEVREGVIQKGGHVLIVATRPDLAIMAKGIFGNKEGEGDICESGLISRVTTRWLGGLLTNYTEFGKLMKVAQNKPDHLVSKAKKRRYFLHRKGRENRVHANSMPSLIIFFHTNEHAVAIKEASLCGIPTVGIVDSNSQRADLLTYAVPGNDDGRESQFFFMSTLKKAMDSGYVSSDQEISSARDSGSKKD